MTYPPDGQWQGPGGPPRQPGPPPTSGFPTQPVPGQPYPQAPPIPPQQGMVRRPSGGTTITAAILVTLMAPVLIWAIILYGGAVIGGRSGSAEVLIQNLVFIIIALVVIADAVLLWMRLPVARLIGIISLAALIVFCVVAVAMTTDSADAAVTSLGLVILLIPVLVALLLLCLPSTGRYLAARRRPPVQLGYPPQGPPSQW